MIHGCNERLVKQLLREPKQINARAQQTNKEIVKKQASNLYVVSREGRDVNTPARRQRNHTHADLERAVSAIEILPVADVRTYRAKSCHCKVADTQHTC